MTRYLLDTDALIDFSKGIEPAAASVLSWIDGDDVVAVCAISVAEFYSGLTPAEAIRWEGFIMSLSYWNISTHAAMRAGEYRHERARAGYRMTTTDALLAAVASAYDATLVTGNVKDFPSGDVSIFPLR